MKLVLNGTRFEVVRGDDHLALEATYNMFHGEYMYYDKETGNHRRINPAENSAITDLYRGMQQKVRDAYDKVEERDRVSLEEYHQKMFNSKIVFAPFGYGEMAPRDLEAAMYGSILLKPDMGYIDTNPNVFVNDETYIACKYDWSDVEDKIDYILSNYKELQPYLVENMRKRFSEEYSYEKLVLHVYNIFKNMDNIENE